MVHGNGGMLVATLPCAGNTDSSDVPDLPVSGTSGEKGLCVSRKQIEQDLAAPELC